MIEMKFVDVFANFPDFFYLECSHCHHVSPASKYIAWAFYLVGDFSDKKIQFVGKNLLCPNPTCKSVFEYGNILIGHQDAVKAALTAFPLGYFKTPPTFKQALTRAGIEIGGNVEGDIVVGHGNSSQEGQWQLLFD